MKFQIEGQKLRIRIDEDELARLLAGEALATRTGFADAFAISFAVRTTQDDAATLIGQADAWQIGLPDAELREHAARLPTREGLRYTLAGKGTENTLQLLFDVDVRDSVRHRRSS
ncbi:MAG: hypothetical protein WAM90_09545 [Rhodanobacter sp.]